MKHILLAVVVVCVAGLASTGEAQGAKFSGYMAPNLRLIDNGENAKSNLGFGMAFNRFTFSGEVDAGDIVKKVAWVVETDISQSGGVVLQSAYVQPKFNDMASVRFGYVKKAFSRETLHPTSKLLTVDRSPACARLKDLGYGDFDYGLEFMLAQEKFKVTAGAYAGFTGATPTKNVAAQDPCLDLGIRAIYKATPCLEIGVNAMRVALPQGLSNDGWYHEDSETNAGLGWGFDLGLNRNMGDMNLQALVEFGQGDNWADGPNEPKAGDTWEDYSWYAARYMTAKALLRINETMGVHLGYTMADPNTDEDDDGETVITPGFTYFWSKGLRTQVEAQLVSYQDDDVDGLTHFVLQQVFVW